MTEIRVGFLSASNYALKNTFSGTLYSMHRALASADGVTVVDLGWPGPRTLMRRLRRKLRLTPRLRGSDPDLVQQSRRFARRVQRQLRRQPVDVVFAPVASEELAQLELRQPVVYASDVTFRLFLSEYQRDYGPEREAYLEEAERSAVRRAARLVYSSEWAARSAVEDYGADPERIRIVPFGANIENPPAADEIGKSDPRKGCRLLFVGREFERKGGRIALDAHAALVAAGVDAELLVMGCEPPAALLHPGVRVIPYLDKNDPAQLEEIRRIYRESHFFILPTRADCSPIVLCEANAYGLPVVTTDVGGIPSIVHEEENGFMLSRDADGEAFARVLRPWIESPEAYERLVRSSRRHYDSRLNWDAWGERLREILHEACG